MDKDFYIEKCDGEYHLKKQHTQGYYCQIQGQLAITGLPWCDFCILFSESNEMFVERIPFDENFWLINLLPKLKDFYFNHGFDFLVSKYN